MKDYFEHWGITKPVFKISDAELDFFLTEDLEATLKRLLFFIQQSTPLLKITAAPGTGKTSFANYLYHLLPLNTHEVLIFHPVSTQDSAGWMFPHICKYFGCKDDIGTAMAELVTAKRKLCVILDDAQHIHEDGWEDINRMIGEQHSNDRFISFVVIGDQNIKTNTTEKFGFASTLSPLTESETENYIKDRLAKNALPVDLFSKNAIQVTHKISKGIFSIISTICENSLLEAFVQNASKITPTISLSASKYFLHESALSSVDIEPSVNDDKHSEPAPEKSEQKPAPKQPSIKLSDLLLEEDLT